MAFRGGCESSIMCSDYVHHSNGRCTNMDILREKNLAVLCADTSFTPNLYYYVGRINGTKITWGNYIKYTTGRNPNVALFRHNDNVYAVECHDTNFLRCHYHIWKYNPEQRIMEGKMKGEPLCDERNPKICANNDGWLVAVFRSNKYALGEVIFNADPDLMTIRWTVMDRFAGSNPDVSVSGNTVVMAMTTKLTVKTYIGKLLEDKSKVDWGSAITAPGTGWYPSIAINKEGQVMLSSQTIAGRKITLMQGTAQANSITWNRTSKTRGFFGEYPSIAFHGRFDFFVTYKTNFGRSIRVKSGYITAGENDNEADYEDQLQPNPRLEENSV